MGRLKKEKKGVSIYTRLAVAAIVFIVAAFGEFLFLCLRKVPDTSYVSVPRVILPGDAVSCEPYAPVKLTVMDINDDNGSCFLVVQSITDGRRRDGWVKKGEPVAFAADLLGDTEIFVELVEKKKVSVVFLCKPAGKKYRFSWPWE